EGRVRIVGRVAGVDGPFIGRLGPPPQLGQRLVTGNGQQPGRDRRARLEPVGLPPDPKEHFAGDVLRQRLAAEQPQYETVDARMMPGEQDLHRKPATATAARRQYPGRARQSRCALVAPLFWSTNTPRLPRGNLLLTIHTADPSFQARV